MVESAGKLIASHLSEEPGSTRSAVAPIPESIMRSSRWNRDQLKLAFHLYCQLPFGKLDSKNPEIVLLGRLIGRTSGAVAMKLTNFASLDPAITSTGRTGLSNASTLDKEIWDAFHADWEGLALECALLRKNLGQTAAIESPTQTDDDEWNLADYTGETRRVLSEQRIKQSFFRRAVLSSYRGTCCMTGITESRLLLASHIVPWSKDKHNRLNPRNGLCLSALHDRAFDRGLISLSDDFRVLISPQLARSRKQEFIKQSLLDLEGHKITLPTRFRPDIAFIRKHREDNFKR